MRRLIALWRAELAAYRREACMSPEAMLRELALGIYLLAIVWILIATAVHVVGNW